MTSTGSDAADEQVPFDTLGPCRLLRRLGSGGMGTVYLAELVEARDYAPLGARLAVKVLHSERVRDAGGIARFEREARLGSEIGHPALVRTHEAGSYLSDGQQLPYLVMELAEGVTLRALLDDLGRLPEPLVRDIGLQLADGLAAVHAVGAVHRDVKPENVLIAPSHLVRLLDLGVALADDGAGRFTSSSLFLGSLAYASPEQFGAGVVGPASDLYSLGVVLHEAIAGERPFAADDVPALIRLHLERRPRRLGEIVVDASRFIEEVVATLLEKDPALRFGSAAELVSVLAAGEDSGWWHEREPSAAAHRPRELRGPSVRRDTQLVGREPELAALHAFEQAALRGEGRFVLLEGEAGVGKSRLLAELVAAMAPDAARVHVLHGSHDPSAGGGARGAVPDALVAHLGAHDLEDRLVRLDPELRAVAPSYAAWLTGRTMGGDVRELSTDALQAATARVARALAAQRPVTWLVEDLHAATAQQRALVFSLARLAREIPLLVVATTRPGLPADEQAQAMRLGVERLPIGRLSPRAVIDLLGEALRSERLARELGGLVAERSDGNPYFVLELVHELKDRGIVEQRADGSFTAHGRVAQLEVPSSVRSLLLARLADLGEDERTILDVAAVQGFSFDADLVARVLGRKRLDVLQALARLERRSGLVRAAGSVFRFDHHLLQELLADALPPALATEYHALLADAFAERECVREREPRELTGDTAVFLAWHYLRAGRSDDGLVHARRALGHLAAHHRHDALLALVELALEAAGDASPALTCDLRLHQAACLDVLVRRDEELAALEAARVAARASGDTRLQGLAGCRVAMHLYVTAKYPAAVEVAAEVGAAAERDGEVGVAAEADSLRGCALLELGRLEEAERCQVRALDLARSVDDPAREAMASCNLANALYRRARAAEAWPFYERAIALFEEVRQARFALMTRINLANVLSDLGRIEESREALESAVALCHEVGDRRIEAIATGNLGNRFNALARYAEARRHWTRALELAREVGHQLGCVTNLGNLATLDLQEGRLEDAEQRLNECLVTCRRQDIRVPEGRALRDLALLAEERGDHESAAALHVESLALLEAQDQRALWAESAVACARHQLARGDRDAALALFERAEKLTLERGFLEVGSLPTAYLALMGERDPLHVVPAPALLPATAETHLVLFRAGAGAQHLTSARECVERISSHLDGDALAAFWRHAPIARGVLEAEAVLRSA